MISSNDEAAIEMSKPGWLDPDGDFHEVRAFMLGMPWPHQEWAAKHLPGEDDPERELERRGWWKLNIAMDASMLSWMGTKDATTKQRAFLYRWTKERGIRTSSDDFKGFDRHAAVDRWEDASRKRVAAMVETTDETPRQRIERIKSDNRRAEEEESRQTAARRAEIEASRPAKPTVQIEDLPVVLTLPVPVHASEIDGRDLVGTGVVRMTHSIAPLAADAGEVGPDGHHEFHIAADFALGFHVTRHFNGRKFHVHVRLDELARAIDEEIAKIDAAAVTSPQCSNPECRISRAAWWNAASSRRSTVKRRFAASRSRSRHTSTDSPTISIDTCSGKTKR